MTKEKYWPEKGHYCVIYTRAYDIWPAGWRVVRAVKVTKKGLITHVIENRNWRKSTKANEGNSLTAKFVHSEPEEPYFKILTISEYADYDLSDLDGEIYPTRDRVREAIVEG